MNSEVGIWELRHNLSKHLARVKQGESLVVTERGDEVARLIPSGPKVDAYARLTSRFGASVPVADIDAVVNAFKHEPSPSGTADRLLAEARRKRV